MSNRTKTILVISAIAVFLTVIAVLLVGCKSTKPTYQTFRNGLEPPPICTNCPPCYDCSTNPPLPALDTNALYVEVVFCNTVIADTNFPVPFYIVTKANNLSNGVTYLWERTFGDLSEGLIPLSTFTATTNFAYRTN